MGYVIIFLCSIEIDSLFNIFFSVDVYDKSVEIKELEPSEIQNAMCNIVTDQIKATANATITRQLKGVCHASKKNHNN